MILLCRDSNLLDWNRVDHRQLVSRGRTTRPSDHSMLSSSYYGKYPLIASLSKRGAHAGYQSIYRPERDSEASKWPVKVQLGAD